MLPEDLKNGVRAAGDDAQASWGGVAAGLALLLLIALDWMGVFQ